MPVSPSDVWAAFALMHERQARAVHGGPRPGAMGGFKEFVSTGIENEGETMNDIASSGVDWEAVWEAYDKYVNSTEEDDDMIELDSNAALEEQLRKEREREAKEAKAAKAKAKKKGGK